MLRAMLGTLLAAILLPGCYDSTLAPRDVTPPAAPRGVYSVTGDTQVTFHWLANTEADVAGYNIYDSPCANGPGCPYSLVGTTVGTSFVVSGLGNGATKYFAVAAIDRAGNESDLSYDDIWDTPRPAGSGALLRPWQTQPALSGWDFAAHTVRAWNDARTDVYFSADSTIDLMLTRDPSSSDIQDMGFASSLDAVDFAPPAGWSPTGSVELIVGHNYVVWTSTNHYAKFRVIGLSGQLVFDWAYQIDPGNGQLRATPAMPAALSAGRATTKP